MIAQLTQELNELLIFDRITNVETIQSLWSGYGLLLRVTLSGLEFSSVIVKRIAPPSQSVHPRGWNSEVGHQRKLRSYEVEATWYQNYNHRCDGLCRTPALIGFQQLDGCSLLVLEDLDRAGFALRKRTLEIHEIKRCLDWLAAFHARFMLEKPTGLWEIGTYWHLDTRPEEYEVMASGSLKVHAHTIDATLNNSRFQTLVHGDAKYANFCFSKSGEVAAVDFQYVGGGCGIKDVAYLLSCLEGGPSGDRFIEELLTHYFTVLQTHLMHANTSVDFAALESEWRILFPFAWADFERFLMGWAPNHWKSTAYSKKQVDIVLAALQG